MPTIHIPTPIADLDRFQHIAENMVGLLTCEDGTRWHPVELFALVKETKALRAALAQTTSPQA